MLNIYYVVFGVFHSDHPTLLALVRPDGLRRAQSRHLLRGFWVNYGSVAALQILCDSCRVTIALLQFTFQKVLFQLRDAFQSLH